jgi:hypothetical protein
MSALLFREIAHILPYFEKKRSEFLQENGSFLQVLTENITFLPKMAVFIENKGL